MMPLLHFSFVVGHGKKLKTKNFKNTNPNPKQKKRKKDEISKSHLASRK
jgi:hypothetical protein